MSDPLSDFLQNGRNLPVKVQVQQSPPPQSAGLFDFLNPIEWLKNEIRANNPQVKQVMALVEQNGGDAKGAFMKECEKRGKNSEEIIQQIRNNPILGRFFK